MNKQLPRTFFLLTALAGGALIGCSNINVNETVSNNPTELSSTFSVEESLSMESNLNDKSEVYTESKGMENQEPSMADDMPENFSVKDIFVSGSSFEEDRPYMLVDINDIISTGRTLKKTESTEHLNGRFVYWEDEGIIYVTYSNDTDLFGLILTKEGFSLNCGLKIGMTEAEIPSLGLTFKKFVKEDLIDYAPFVFVSNFIKDENNPVNTEDFDSLYVYVGAIPEEEMIEYGITSTCCISIVALIKDGTISKIMLDMPTAG